MARIYIAHLTSLASDSTVKPDDQAKLKGYLRKWKEPKVLISTALFIEVLKPASILSLTLQYDSIDIVYSIQSILKTIKSLKYMSDKDPKEWPSLQLVQTRIDDHNEYQGVPVTPNFETVLSGCKADALADLHTLEENIKGRLEWSDLRFLRCVLIFLDTQCWVQKNESNVADPEESGEDKSLSSLLDAVEHIISLFRAPLEAKGMCVASVQDELKDVVDFARKYLPLGTMGYRNIWFKLHTCPDPERWPIIRLLSELLFSLPFTTSRVEQIFSRLKVVKTKLRSSLDTNTVQSLLDICVEGPSLQNFDVDSAIDIWWKDCTTTRRPSQSERREYRPRPSSSDVAAASPADNEERERETFILDDWDECFDIPL